MPPRLAAWAAINDQEEAAPDPNAVTLEAQESKAISAYEHALRCSQSGQPHDAQVELAQAGQSFPFLGGEAAAGSDRRGACCCCRLQVAAFRLVLADPVVGTGASEQLLRIKYLSLKNLGALLAGAAETAAEALRCYCDALEVDDSDVVLWNRLGTLVSRAGPAPFPLRCACGGLLGSSDEALKLSAAAPSYPPSQAAQQGAWAAARHAYERGLECDPAHPSLQDKLLLLLLHVGDAGAAKAMAAEILRRNPRHATARALASGRSVVLLCGGQFMKGPDH